MEMIDGDGELPLRARSQATCKVPLDSWVWGSLAMLGGVGRCDIPYPVVGFLSVRVDSCAVAAR